MDDILDEVHLKFQISKLYQAINRILQDRERLIIEHRYGLVDGCRRTQREIAKMLGISRSYVSRIEKRAIDKLSKAMK